MSSSYVYFFAAYVVIWAGLAWYMSTLSRKQKLLRDEIHALKSRLRVRE
ncbi:CcmD family protein [candidate division KSB3 bacterium]|uniref:CcmD family protein n=1 Tax=candidate division KSB3 bacterium TaxID=2044937 RepID=A0A9D5JY32_9BACT|nr:CcmD family protein [candidate division KSB3 bacterium]MBD3326363.1 CcmD family protein [candidate division KSB3 bacterium]